MWRPEIWQGMTTKGRKEAQAEWLWRKPLRDAARVRRELEPNIKDEDIDEYNSLIGALRDSLKHTPAPAMPVVPYHNQCVAHGLKLSLIHI